MRRIAFVLLAAAAMLGARPAHASPTDGMASSGARRFVELSVSADEADRRALEDSLRELLGRVDIDLRPVADGALAHAQVIWSDSTVKIVVRDADGRVAVEREVPRGASSAITVEDVAHVIYTSIEELADAARTPPPPQRTPIAPAEAPLVPRAPAKEAPRSGTASPRWGIDGGAFFAGRAFGSDAASVLGGGGMVGGALGRERFRPALWLSATYHVAFDVSGPLVDVHVKALALRLTPTVRLFGGPGWFLEAGPEGGVDVLWVTPRATGIPEDRLSGASTRASPVAGAMIAAHVAVASTADLFIAAVGDVDVTPYRYVIREGAEHDGAFQPWRVRPALVAGFSFTAVGAALYPAMEAQR